MNTIVEISFLDIEERQEDKELIHKVLTKCMQMEQLSNTNLSISVTLTNPQHIKEMNHQYRNIDKETDVLSFPMFEKEEIEQIKKQKEHPVEDVLGDIVISISRVEEQAKEYGHCFEREFAYMLVHGFYHIIGYDHIEEEDKVKMRAKEETILQELNIARI